MSSREVPSVIERKLWELRKEVKFQKDRALYGSPNLPMRGWQIDMLFDGIMKRLSECAHELAELRHDGWEEKEFKEE